MKKVSLFFAALLCATTMSAITFVPQGGTLATAPETNAALWEEYKVAYNAFTNDARADQPIDKVNSFVTHGKDFATNGLSPWKWLGDYMIYCVPELADVAESKWTWTMLSFFNCRNAKDAASTYGERTHGYGDWTIAGQPAAWQPWYVFGIAPTNGDKVFGGWYLDAACTGEALTTLAGVDVNAVLYAKWEGETAIESIEWGTVAPIAAGQTIGVAPTVNPSNTTEAYTCASSDSTVAIATITAEGVSIKGIKAGTATITLTFTAGISTKEITVTEGYTFELHEGTLEILADNEDLWEQFVPAYNEYYDTTRVWFPMEQAATFISSSMTVSDFLTNEASDWKWLGDYIARIVIAQNPEKTELADLDWRFNLQNFFSAGQFSAYPYPADFTSAGCSGIWRPYYVLAQTPVREGYTFKGWFLDEAHTEKAEAATLPASGTLHAEWESNTATALENATIEANVTKVIENGQLVIIRDGVRYNALGAIVK